jgi:hypothetical protein
VVSGGQRRLHGLLASILKRTVQTAPRLVTHRPLWSALRGNTGCQRRRRYHGDIHQLHRCGGIGLRQFDHLATAIRWAHRLMELLTIMSAHGSLHPPSAPHLMRGDCAPRLPSRRTSQSAALINCSRVRQLAFIHCFVSRSRAVSTARADGPRASRNSVISSKSRLRWFSINAYLLRALICSAGVRGRGMQVRRRRAGTVERSQRSGAKIRALNIERPTVWAVPVTESVTKDEILVTFR